MSRLGWFTVFKICFAEYCQSLQELGTIIKRKSGSMPINTHLWWAFMVGIGGPFEKGMFSIMEIGKNREKIEIFE